jgi:hypothetical protein
MDIEVSFTETMMPPARTDTEPAAVVPLGAARTSVFGQRSHVPLERGLTQSVRFVHLISGPSPRTEQRSLHEQAMPLHLVLAANVGDAERREKYMARVT